MCDKDVVENGGTLELAQCVINLLITMYMHLNKFPNPQEMCDKTVDICPSVIQLVPECFKTQQMFDKAIDCYETQKVYEKAFSENSFMLKYCLDRYKTQKVCDKAFSEDSFMLKYGLA